MNVKKGAGAIIYRENDKGEKEYLVLHRIKGWEGYEFAKGGIEKGEDAKEAVRREISEEVGLKNLKISENFDKKVSWEKKGKKYDYHYFLAKADKDEEVKLPGREEHDSYEWLTKEEALKKITHNHIKEVLEEADEEKQ